MYDIGTKKFLKSGYIWNAPAYAIDSSGLPVCHLKRQRRHKTFQLLAQFGKSSVGWFFGLKLHIVINDKKEKSEEQISFYFSQLNALIKRCAKNNEMEKLLKSLGIHGVVVLDKSVFELRLAALYSPLVIVNSLVSEGDIFIHCKEAFLSSCVIEGDIYLAGNASLSKCVVEGNVYYVNQGSSITMEDCTIEGHVYTACPAGSVSKFYAGGIYFNDLNIDHSPSNIATDLDFNENKKVNPFFVEWINNIQIIEEFYELISKKDMYEFLRSLEKKMGKKERAMIVKAFYGCMYLSCTVGGSMLTQFCNIHNIFGNSFGKVSSVEPQFGVLIINLMADNLRGSIA